MGYVFEELIRIGAEQANEEAGEHFTPREVIKLMVNLLLSPEKDLRRSHVVKTIYDPACGTGGMLSVSEKYIRDLNADAKPILYGQDWNRLLIESVWVLTAQQPVSWLCWGLCPARSTNGALPDPQRHSGADRRTDPPVLRESSHRPSWRA
jgi:N-6 DNA methylase